MFNFTDEQLQQLEADQDVILEPDQIMSYVANLQLSLTSLAEEMLGPNGQQSQIGQVYENLKARIDNIKTECEAGKIMVIPSDFPRSNPYFATSITLDF